MWWKQTDKKSPFSQRWATSLVGSVPILFCFTHSHILTEQRTFTILEAALPLSASHPVSSCGKNVHVGSRGSSPRGPSVDDPDAANCDQWVRWRGEVGSGWEVKGSERPLWTGRVCSELKCAGKRQKGGFNSKLLFLSILTTMYFQRQRKLFVREGKNMQMNYSSPD